MTNEVTEIQAAIQRTEADRKNACAVLYSLRADILKNVSCETTTFTATYDNTDTSEFIEYNGIFDDFHYDIGHGKGSGDGGSAQKLSGTGDYEVD